MTGSPSPTEDRSSPTTSPTETTRLNSRLIIARELNELIDLCEFFIQRVNELIARLMILKAIQDYRDL